MFLKIYFPITHVINNEMIWELILKKISAYKCLDKKEHLELTRLHMETRYEENSGAMEPKWESVATDNHS